MKDLHEHKNINFLLFYTTLLSFVLILLCKILVFIIWSIIKYFNQKTINYHFFILELL